MAELSAARWTRAPLLGPDVGLDGRHQGHTPLIAPPSFQAQDPHAEGQKRRRTKPRSGAAIRLLRKITQGPSHPSH